ncbi:MAG: hypothetical protein Q9208_008334, partial [Pyrenodesmia sp. 3 TL-2023]
MRATGLKIAIWAMLAIWTAVLAANDIEYLILPHFGLSISRLLALQEDIEKLAGGSSKVYTSTRKGSTKPEFWVRDIKPNESVMQPFAKYARQRSPSPELRMVSQPPGFETLDRFQDYVYRTDVQREIFIYHAELGINQNHEDFRGRKIEWLYTKTAHDMGYAVMGESPLAEDPGHSTCTASKATGNIYGAAKFATLVVTKMPNLNKGSVIEVFRTIADDVREKKRQYHSIVSVSWGSKQPTMDKYFAFYGNMIKHLEELTKELNVLVVFSAGNDAQIKDGDLGRWRLRTDTFPAELVDRKEGMMAVANCNLQGERWRGSQQTKKHNPFAPGVGIKCAAGDSEQGYQTRLGTSF